jgi:hypothetical protein
MWGGGESADSPVLLPGHPYSELYPEVINQGGCILTFPYHSREQSCAHFYSFTNKIHESRSAVLHHIVFLISLRVLSFFPNMLA